MTKHSQKSVIVTGGGSGIGQAAALILAKSGYAVTVADINKMGGEQTVSKILELHGCAQFVALDVTDEESVMNSVQCAVSAYGGLDAAINSVGIPQAGKIVHEMSVDEWDLGNAVNLRGMFLCVKHQLIPMLDAGSGAIACVSSVAALKGLVHSVEYCATKAGVTGLVRAAAVDYADKGIRINALLPGGTDTPLAKQSQINNPAIVGTLSVPMGRMASPEEIAESAVWLVSDKSSYITGACIAADGGMSIA